RTALAFEPPHGTVAVHAHHEHVGLRTRAFQVTHVADVQDVEAAVGEGHRAAGRARLLHPPPDFVEGPDLLRRAPHAGPRSGPGAGSLSTARFSSGWATVAVPRFITTMPPA